MATKKTVIPKSKASSTKSKKGPGPGPKQSDNSFINAMKDAERRKEFLGSAATIGPLVGAVTGAILRKEPSEKYQAKSDRQGARAARKERRADVKTAKISTASKARGEKLAKKAESLRTKAAALKEKSKTNASISEKLFKSGY